MSTVKELSSTVTKLILSLGALLALAASAASQEAPPGPTTSAPTPASAPATQTAVPEDSGAVRMVQPGTFEIHVQGADLRQVLQLLSTQGRKNIVATRDVAGKVSADLYGVTFKEALEAVLRSSGFVYEEKGNFIYVYTPKQLEDIRLAERKIAARLFHLSYVTANDAKTLITPALSKDGAISVTPAAAVGISTSKTDAGGNSYATDDTLVVRDYEENLQRIAEMIRDLDVKPEQVLIEATILRATLTEDNALGIDFNILAGVDFNALASTSNGLTNVVPGTITDGQVVKNQASFRSDTTSSIPAGGMTIGFLSSNVGLFVRALESVTDVTVMANPKLLVINKQRGEVMVGNRDGYLTTTFTETTATQTVQFLETGTRLIVRPYIARDGFVRMEVHPEDSSGSVKVVGVTGLPSETTTEMTSNVLVRDGHTIVIGGLFRERSSINRSQTPLLGSIPYVGTLFRSSADNTAREEVIILLTPHVVKQAADEAVGEMFRDDAERFRVGLRKGLMWFGRERLAQAHMRWAKQALDNGQRDKAMWNLDMALSMEPRMEEAIRLKERLSGRAFWSDEAQYSAVKYVIERMMMQELRKPVERIIPPGKPRDADQIEPAVRERFGIQQRYEDPLPEPENEYPLADEPTATSRPAGGEDK